METQRIVWKDFYEVEELEAEKELETEKELKSQAEKLAEKDSTCTHTPVKARKSIKKPVGFDFTYIEKLLSDMDTIEDQIRWLQNFLTQLQQSQKAMAFNSWGLTSANALESQQKAMTPYIQTTSLAIREIQKKIRLLRDERKRRMRQNHRK